MVSNSQTASEDGWVMGVLVAVSIPFFTAQLEKSREATDEANLRSLYAEATAAVLAEDTGASTWIKNGTLTVAKGDDGVYTGTATYTCTQQKNSLEGNDDGTVNIGGVDVSASAFGSSKVIKIVIKSDGSAPTIGAGT